MVQIARCTVTILSGDIFALGISENCHNRSTLFGIIATSLAGLSGDDDFIDN